MSFREENFMRRIMRFTSTIWLAAAVIVGVADTVQSFATGKTVLTSGGEVWQSLWPQSYEVARAYAEAAASEGQLSSAFDMVLGEPAFALFLALSLLFWMMGYSKPKPAGRFAA
jgi:hypothetical protein